jgi:pyruvate, water dikinase
MRPGRWAVSAVPRRLRAAWLLVLGLFFAGCPSGDSGSLDDSAPTVAPGDPECAEAEARLGYTACLHSIPDEAAYEQVTVTSTAVDQLQVGKYLVPAVDDARLPPLWMVVDTFALHYEFLVTAFPDDFAGLSTQAYYELILYPSTREFYAGSHAVFMDSDGIFYGFTVWDDPADVSATVTMDDVTRAWQQLQERFELGELYFVPGTGNQQDAAASWSDPPFPIRGLEELAYEVYNPGEAYGTLQLYTLAELGVATEQAAYSYQNILGIAEAPTDLERVVSGIVTGTRQGDLSHLNVRSLGRGTPNCYIAEPLEALAAWEDQLVRFECGETTWSIEATSSEAAAAWWAELRPDPVEVCIPDTSVSAMPGLLELDTSSAEARATALCRYGAKGTNLATLYQRIEQVYQLDGFVIPFAWYDTFMQANSWEVDLGEGLAEHSFTETVAAWHADEAFLGDATLRRERLEALRAAMVAAPHDPALVTALAEAILATYGSSEVMVRFRSSSNAEDALTFNGAGLYESTSACLADSLDDDDLGPSLCDPDKAEEESLEEALGTVWSSLWKMSAWDERDWYGIDHTAVAMGILSTTRAKDEAANAVAFTGNPTAAGDDRYLVNAQVGELEVVSTESGVTPERVLLTVEAGEVAEILRVEDSSEVMSGQHVLSDGVLEDMGALLYEITQVHPSDQALPEGYALLWDTEWKRLSDGRIIIKQIRPYLRQENE